MITTATSPKTTRSPAGSARCVAVTAGDDPAATPPGGGVVAGVCLTHEVDETATAEITKKPEISACMR